MASDGMPCCHACQDFALLLQGHGEVDGRHHGGKLGQEAVARVLDYASFVLLDTGLDKFRTGGQQCSVGAFFIAIH